MEIRGCTRYMWMRRSTHQVQQPHANSWYSSGSVVRNSSIPTWGAAECTLWLCSYQLSSMDASWCLHYVSKLHNLAISFMHDRYIYFVFIDDECKIVKIVSTTGRPQVKVPESATTSTAHSFTTLDGERKFTMILCSALRCDDFGHGWQDYYCCLQKQKCYETMEVCRANCPLCNPKCTPQ